MAMITLQDRLSGLMADGYKKKPLIIYDLQSIQKGNANALPLQESL